MTADTPHWNVMTVIATPPIHLDGDGRYCCPQCLYVEQLTSYVNTLSSFLVIDINVVSAKPQSYMVLVGFILV